MSNSRTFEHLLSKHNTNTREKQLRKRALQFVSTVDYLIKHWLFSFYALTVPMDLVSLIALFAVKYGGVPYFIGYNASKALCGISGKISTLRTLTRCEANADLRFDFLAISSHTFTLCVTTEGRLLFCKDDRVFESVTFKYDSLSELKNVSIIALNSGCDYNSHFVCTDTNQIFYHCDNSDESFAFAKPITRSALDSYVITHVSCGGVGLSVFLTQCGRVLCSGDNAQNQCGLYNGATKVTKPKEVSWFIENEVKIRQVCCGYMFWACVDTQDRMWILGNSFLNIYMNVSEYDVPKNPYLMQSFVENQVRIDKIRCGRKHVITLDLNNSVWVFGSMVDGLLGNGKLLTLNVSSIGIPQKVKINSNDKIVAIKSGNYHVCSITERNDYWFWGLDKYSQIRGLCKCTECDNNRELDFVTIPHLVSFALDNMIDVYLGKWRTALIIDE